MKRNILIAGASRGLGLYLYNDLKNTDSCFAVSKSGSNDTIPCDISIYDDVNDCFTNIEKQGMITHLVVTAGVYGPLGPFHTNDIYNWNYALETNLFGPANLAHRAIPNMIKKNYGKIVFLSGGGATRAMYGASSYGASKAGLVRFAETLAHELAQYNIDVNCVAPGAMNTEFLEQALEAGPKGIGKEFYEACEEQKQTGGVKFNVPANLIKYLLSEQSDGVSGKLHAAVWDKWLETPKGLSDLYTLKRMT
jgi:NAD(P)-dependent dehydrogenase (short-subunit alcohol dehydrogenase family)